MSSKTSQIPIGRFSLMTRLSQKALRLYDKKELLVPLAKDEITGYRYYTISQIETGIKIKMLVNFGFGIEEIKDILSKLNNNDTIALRSMFSKRLSEIQLEIGRLKKIEEIIIDNKPLELLYMNCSEPHIKNVPKIRVISKREKGTYGVTIGKLINELMQQIFSPDNQRTLVKITGPVMFICYDDEYKENGADIEVAIPVMGRVSVNSDDIEVKNLPECEVVSVIYTGPYDNVGEGHTKAMKFALDNGYKLNGHSRELYLNSPGQVPDDQLMTEIQQPVIRK